MNLRTIACTCGTPFTPASADAPRELVAAHPSARASANDNLNMYCR